MGTDTSRLLGIDPGRKRIGVAISDPLRLTAQGLETISITSRADAIGRIKLLAELHEIRALVLGLPLNMDGSEGESAREARRLGAALGKSLGLPVYLWDERLTTLEADRLMMSAGLSRKKRSGRVDSLAAQIILQSYLDAHRHDDQ